ncbi:zinc-ribbon domain-containing protein, partial [Conyzicola sp.]|uniref:zinc-ribbon domain-containing protein n=1 Tax=Conyzicola sp. TaxID=1969404 RepID=UPI0039893ECF
MKCRNCDTVLPAGAMFCGECGAAVAVPKLVEPQTRMRPGDTAIIQPLDLNASVPEFLEPDFGVAAEPAPVRAAPTSERAPVPAPTTAAAPEPTPAPAAPPATVAPPVAPPPVAPPPI